VGNALLPTYIFPGFIFMNTHRTISFFVLGGRDRGAEQFLLLSVDLNQKTSCFQTSNVIVLRERAFNKF